MDTFSYKGIANGKYVEGEIEALNQEEASHKLKEQKIIITNLAKSKKKKDHYREYLKKFRGIGLNYNYSEKRFNKYIKNFNYLNQNNQDNYIKVERKNNFYVITDGLHRASIMKNKRVNKIIVEEKIF